MNNIEKLAIEYGKASNTVMRYNEMSQQMLLDGYNFTKSELEAFAKALQQSSEPVAEIKKRDGDYNYIHWYTLLQQLAEGTLLFTLPPASVPLEKYNKLLDALKLLDLEALTYIHHYQVGRNLYDIVQKAIAEAELSERKEG